MRHSAGTCHVNLVNLVHELGCNKVWTHSLINWTKLQNKFRDNWRKGFLAAAGGKLMAIKRGSLRGRGGPRLPLTGPRGKSKHPCMAPSARLDQVALTPMCQVCSPAKQPISDFNNVGWCRADAGRLGARGAHAALGFLDHPRTTTDLVPTE